MLNGGINGPVNSVKSSSPKASGTWDAEDNYTQVKGLTKSNIVTQGLQVYLDSANPASYPGSGGTWYDISGNGLNFTGDASFIAAGQGLRSGSAWSSATTGVLNTDTYSLFFSIKFNSTSTYPQAWSDNWEKIFSYNAGGTDRSPSVWRFPSDRGLHWRAQPNNMDSDFYSDAAGTKFALDTWYYVGVTKNGATTKSYVNGVLVRTATVDAVKTAGTAPMILFEAYTLASANIDNLHAYSRTISDAEVVQNYNAGKTRLNQVPMSYLVIGGGGGGGKDMGGGGGAGGYVAGSTYITPGTYSVSVGPGGYGSPAGSGGVRTDGVTETATGHQFTVSATNGQDSYLEGTARGIVRAKGGGYGGSSYFDYTPNQGYGAAGGSGGGASGYSNGTTGRQGLANQLSSMGYGNGNNGGNNATGQYWSAGGGGAGAAGASSSSTVAADGGVGIQNDILGTNYYWAGGGGGAGYSREGGNGGAGGGGAGAVGTKTGGSGLNAGGNTSGGGINSWAQVPGGNGGANTGGGGGGGSHYNATNKGGEGGSGIVVVRYPDYYPDLLVAGSVRYVRNSITGYKMYRFISGTGTFTMPELNQAPSSVVTSGLQMYLDASAQIAGETTWRDLSGNARHATLYNAPTLSNRAYVFNGTNQYAQAPSGFALNTGFTICALVNMGTPSLWERIIDFGNGAGIDNILFARNGTSTTLSAQIASASPGWMVHQVDVIVDSTWMFLTWTYNGAISTLGVNGTYYTLASAVTIPNVTRTLNYIGRSNWGSDAYFESGMQVIMVYDRALSQTETTQNFNAFRARYGL